MINGILMSLYLLLLTNTKINQIPEILLNVLNFTRMENMKYYTLNLKKPH